MAKRSSRSDVDGISAPAGRLIKPRYALASSDEGAAEASLRSSGIAKEVMSSHDETAVTVPVPGVRRRIAMRPVERPPPPREDGFR